MDEQPPATDPSPEFGPAGYLPERAAKRARKIVLRAPMGIHWVFGSLFAGLIVVVAGVLLLTRGSADPGAPFRDLGPLEALPANSILPSATPDGRDVVVIIGEGRIRAFTRDGGVEGLAWCDASRHVEDGVNVWNLTGRSLDGGTSLELLPVVATNGKVFVDPSRVQAGPAAIDEGEIPVC